MSQLSRILSSKRAVVGFDGFVDTLMRAVDKRIGEDIVTIDTISDFGDRILSAAGKSANIELVRQSTRIGGNGPLLSNGLLELGLNVNYIGTVGNSKNTIFSEFVQSTNAISIGDYSETRAIEFHDGKLLLGEMEPLISTNVEQIKHAISFDNLISLMSMADIFAATNWTMMPHMTEIIKFFLSDIFPYCYSRDRIIFFDLADPQKRRHEELLEFLKIITLCNQFGRVVLGLNVREAEQVLRVLKIDISLIESEHIMLRACSMIREALSLSVVFIHGIKLSVAVDKNSECSASGYYVECPKLSTGAGDHYNAGFLAAYVSDYSLRDVVHFAAATASLYVSTGQSPDVLAVEQRLL